MPKRTSIQKRVESEMHNFAQLLLQGGYTNNQKAKIARICGDGIDDHTWEGLKTKYRLPEGAREGLLNVVVSYWEFRSDFTISRNLAPKITAGIAQLSKLNETLSDLRNDRDFFKGFHAYYDPSPSEQRASIDEVIASLQKLQLLLKNAEVRTKAPAHRPSHRAVWHALRVLDAMLKFNNVELTNDKNSIAYPILRLADPKLANRAIRDTLRGFFSVLPLWDWTGHWVEDKFR